MAFGAFNVAGFMAVTMTMTMPFALAYGRIGNQPNEHHKHQHRDLNINGDMRVKMFPFSLHVRLPRLAMPVSMPVFIMPMSVPRMFPMAMPNRVS